MIRIPRTVISITGQHIPCVATMTNVYVYVSVRVALHCVCVSVLHAYYVVMVVSNCNYYNCNSLHISK